MLVANFDPHLWPLAEQCEIDRSAAPKLHSNGGSDEQAGCGRYSVCRRLHSDGHIGARYHRQGCVKREHRRKSPRHSPRHSKHLWKLNDNEWATCRDPCSPHLLNKGSLGQPTQDNLRKQVGWAQYMERSKRDV